MDAIGLLDQLIQSGRELAREGHEFAEEKLALPESGEGRDAMLAGLGKGAIAGGLFALLIGTKRGRRVTGKLIKYGSLAAVAGVAYKTYDHWQSSHEDEVPGMAITELGDREAHVRGVLLVRAMISAAAADGHVDDQELEMVRARLSELNLPEDSVAMLQAEFTQPATPEELAAGVDSLAAASEMYMLAALVIDEANPPERDFLTQLSSALRLPLDLVQQLEEQAFA
tara:strand:+ start:46911 stop:47591 length:681 start_codon:yes stop_codon:yes gene_type:complete